MIKEFEIENESLVYYALRDPISGNYLSEIAGEVVSSNLVNAKFFNNTNLAEAYSEDYVHYSELRKVKVIDLGGIDG